MSNINDQSQDFYIIDAVQDLDNGSAAAVSGGQVADVTLSSRTNQRGRQLETNSAIRDLRRYNFNNITSSVAINNSQTWRFYTGLNFQGDSFDVGPNTGQNVPRRFDNRISSLRSIS